VEKTVPLSIGVGEEWNAKERTETAERELEEDEQCENAKRLDETVASSAGF